MTNYSELKKLAEGAISPDESPYLPCQVAFQNAANPAAVLALIAESERLQREEKNDAIAYKAVIERQEEIRIERDQLKAENKRLSALLECSQGDMRQADQIIEGLRKDAERYRWLRNSSYGQFEDPVVFEQSMSGGHMKYIGPKIGKDLDGLIDSAISKKAQS